MGKRQSLQQAVLLGKLDGCMHINEVWTYPHTMHKNKLKMAKDITIRHDAIKHLENTIRKHFSDIIIPVFS